MNKPVIEFLYADICNLFGESGHVRFIKQLFPQAEFIHTELKDRPAFSQRNVNFIYMGAMTEQAQVNVLKTLMPYREALHEYIEAGKLALFTGNSAEILGRGILEKGKPDIECFNFFPYYTKLSMDEARINDFFLGDEFSSVDGSTHHFEREADDPGLIVGFKTQFTKIFPEGDWPYLASSRRGMGFNEKEKREGVWYKGLIATEMLGPFLILNPYLTERYLSALDAQFVLPHRDCMLEAYRARLIDFANKDAVI